MSMLCGNGTRLLMLQIYITCRNLDFLGIDFVGKRLRLDYFRMSSMMGIFIKVIWLGVGGDIFREMWKEKRA